MTWGGGAGVSYGLDRAAVARAFVFMNAGGVGGVLDGRSVNTLGKGRDGRV